MKRLVSLAALALALATSYPAVAQDVGDHQFKDLGRVLNAVACNAAPAARTWTASAGQGAGWGLGAFQFDAAWAAAAGTMTWTCYGSLDNGTTWAELQACSVASGVCTSSDASWSKAVTAADDWIWRVDFLGVSDIKCVYACTVGAGTETATVYARMSEQ